MQCPFVQILGEQVPLLPTGFDTYAIVLFLQYQ